MLSQGLLISLVPQILLMLAGLLLKEVYSLVLVNIICMKPLYLALIAFAAFIAYKLYSAKTTAPAASAVSPTIISDTLYGAVSDYTNGATDQFNPPPGYSGPDGGPFSWASAGSPPSGLYTVKGIPAGYGFNNATLQYVYIGTGLAPNGMAVMAMS